MRTAKPARTANRPTARLRATQWRKTSVRTIWSHNCRYLRNAGPLAGGRRGGAEGKALCRPLQGANRGSGNWAPENRFVHILGIHYSRCKGGRIARDVVLEISTCVDDLGSRNMHRATIYDGIFHAKDTAAIARYTVEIRRILRESRVIRSIKCALVHVDSGIRACRWLE